MKKAYVKPVFFAEAFEASAYCAGVCTKGINDPINIVPGTDLDATHKHTVSYSPFQSNWTTKGEINTQYKDGVSYWEYAGAEEGDYSDVWLFTTADGTCDFLWDHTKDEIGVWQTVDPNGNGSTVRDESTMVDSDGNFLVNWLGKTFSWFFYGNNSGCDAGYNDLRLVS